MVFSLPAGTCLDWTLRQVMEVSVHILYSSEFCSRILLQTHSQHLDELSHSFIELALFLAMSAGIPLKAGTRKNVFGNWTTPIHCLDGNRFFRSTMNECWPVCRVSVIECTSFDIRVRFSHLQHYAILHYTLARRIYG
jgi:hypothetical protein